MLKIFQRKKIRQDLEVLRSEPTVKFGDIHCHCLPGLDDGPATTKDSLALCRMLAADGVEAVIATPHQLGDFAEVTAERVRREIAALQAVLVQEGLALRIYGGAEVRVDESLTDYIRQGQVLTLAEHGRHLLLELPYETFVDLRFLLDELAGMGIQAIIAHPERHSSLTANPLLIEPWLERKAGLQITASSLIGRSGDLAAQRALEFIRNGWVVMVASDAHNTASRSPCMKDAFQVVAEQFGYQEASRLFVVNPGRVIMGQELMLPGGSRIRKGG